jgi:hypothetical protein
MSKLFTIAGTSVLNGKLTYRFATGKVSVRGYKLKKTGHSDISLQELPEPMTKADAIAFLQSNGIEAVMPKTRVSKKTEAADGTDTAATPDNFSARMAAIRKQKAAETAAALQAAADAEFFASQIANAAADTDVPAATDEAAA